MPKGAVSKGLQQESYSHHCSRDLVLQIPEPGYKCHLLPSHHFLHSTTCSFGVSPLPTSWGAFDNNDFFPESSSWKVQVSCRVFHWYTGGSTLLSSYCAASVTLIIVVVFNYNIYFPADSSVIFAGSSCNT